MSEKNISIGDEELEIMKVIWRAKEPINSAAIGEAVADKGWKRTTIATFLSRLVEKGALYSEQRGKALYYTPRISVGEYRKSQLLNLVKNVFEGSTRDMVASLFEESVLSDEEMEELKTMFTGKGD